jgi:GEVED domain/Secretion system C-terminal sorting domain
MKQINKKVRNFLFTAALLLTGTSLFAQLPMTRSTFNGVYTPIVGGTTSTAFGDDAFQQNIPVGFSFSYLGTPYTQFSVSTNGWMSFANGATFDAFSPNLYATTTNGALAPWWDDLSTSAIVYQTTGTPGTQVCTIQWTSLSYYFTSTRTINYQVKLYEGTNVIEFWYGAAPTGTINTAESASIGIKSITGGNGQYIDAVTGSSFTGNSSLQSDRWPAYNFRYTPGAPTALAAGTYNVGVGQTYRNLNEAAADVNHRGIAGAVSFNLVDAQYDVTVANGSNFFPILIGPVAGSSSANTVTFSKLGTAAIVAYGGASGANGAIANQASTTALASNVDPVFGIVGGDYITINNMDIRGNVGNLLTDHGVGIYNSSVTDGATNNTVSNVTIIMNRANTGSRGFVQNVITTPTAATGANSNNTFRDFTIRSVYAGIQLTGNATFPDLNTQVRRTVCTTFNSIGDPATPNDIGNGTAATYGILATNQSGFTISNNSIRNVTGSAIQTDGISIVTFQGTCTLSNNKIQTIRNSSTSSTIGISGIRMSHTTTGTHTIRVYNNSVSEITSGYTGVASAARTLKGIFAQGTGGTTAQTYEIYDNSVSIDGSGSLNLSSVCFEVNSAVGPVYRLGNNIFANFTATQAGIARHYVYSSPTALTFGPAGTISSNNDLLVANDVGVTGFIGFDGTTNYNTIATWAAAMTPVGLEAASISVNPAFVSNTSDLHATALAINGVGIAPPVYITADLDCATRTPDNDLGAYILVACAGTPTAGTITGVTSVCSGLGTTLTLTGASAGAGITYQWASSTTNGGPYTNLLGTGGTQATGPLTVTTYYVVGVLCTVSGQAAQTLQFTVTVNPLPTVAVTPTSGSVCLPAATPVALTATGGATYSWLPAAGLSSTTIANPTASPAATTTYTVTGTSALGCINTATTTITVGESPSIAAPTATPPSVCSGGNSQLLTAGATTSTYVGTVIPYAVVPTPGVGVTTLANAGVAITPLSAGTLDDGGWQNQTIPFNFMYFGTSYNSFAVSSNGFVWLGTGAPTTFTGYSTTFPSAFAARPAIGPLYSDLDFRTVGTINYFVSGTAPNRKLVINWSNGNFYNAVGSLNTQLIIYETSNIIEAHTTSSTGTNIAVQGIQNAAGTTAFVAPGRNNVNWTVVTPDGYRWAPAGGPVTYSWSPATFLSSTTIANPMANAVTATTTYTVTVANGACSSSGTVTLTAGSLLTSTATASPSTTVCAGSNLTLNGTAIGGGSPYTYSWAGPNSFTSTSQNPTITGITLAGAGTYTLTINDGCAAVSTASVTVVVNPLPTVAVTPTTGLICNPAGSPINLTASGGTSYSWLPATGLSSTTIANPIATPVATTTYTVTGTSALGCVNTATTVITVGAALTMSSVTATPTTVCNGGSSVLTAAASLPAATYCQPTYSNGTQFGDYVSSVVLNTLNNPTGASATPYYTLYPASGNTTTTLTAGTTYTVTLIAGTYTQNDLAVWIDYNQNGTLNDAGEKLGETNNLGAAPASTSITFTVPLTAFNGQVRLRVREMDYGLTNVMDPCATQSTFGETEDYIITITGGASPATYSWSPGTFLSSTTTSPTNATAVTTTTTYTATATSPVGCTATGTVTLTVAPVLTATSSASPSTTVCAGTNETFSATPAGGVGPYTYSWTGPNSFTSSLQNPNIPSVVTASAGTYTCVITDACTSTFTVNVTLTVNPLPVVALSGTPAICAGDSTLLTGTSGGTSQWYMNGVAISGATSNTYYASVAGVYNMIKTNLNTCADSSATGITVIVNALPAVTASASATTVCSGINVTFTGSGASSYAWNNGVTDAVPFAVTTAGYYTVVGTDGNGCVDADSVQVAVNALPVVALGADVAQCGGTVLLDAANAGSAYMWSDMTTAQTLTVSATGTYYVTVTDVNGCMSSDTAMITINAVPVVALGADSAQCGGTITLDAGNAGSTYLWNDMTTAQTLVASASGSYDVTIVDANGCTAADTINVTINAVPVVSLGNDTTVCGGGLILDAMNPGDSYLWSDNSTAQTLTVPGSGTYWVDVTNASGCTTRDSIMVAAGAGPSVTLGNDSTFCGDSYILDAMNPGSSYLWNDNSTGQTLTATTSGTYYVTVTDSIGCSSTDSVSLTINTPPIVSFSLTWASICVDDASITFAGLPAGGVYTGSTGISGTTFDPSNSTLGNQVIVYTYTDVNGCAATATDSITVDPCTGVVDFGSLTNATVYPNPTLDYFTLDLGYVPNSAVTVEIMNSLGQRVDAFTMTSDKKQIDLGVYESGVYSVRLTDGTNTAVIRVVRQ